MSDIGQLKKREIVDEMRDSYLDYAMSVIVSRALPDVRDGLKPVHRRILYAMNEMGLRHTAKYVKSARIVGECFVKGTLVTTTRGLIPIEQIGREDTVYTHGGIRRVTNLYIMPKRKLITVTLANGIAITATPSQKLKVLNPRLMFEWKEVKDLVEQEFLTVKSVWPEIHDASSLFVSSKGQPTHLNENLAYLIGFFTSDGWITEDYSLKKYPRIGFGAAEREIIERIQNILWEEFHYTAHVETKKYRLQNSAGETLNKEMYHLRINNKNINDFLIRNFDLRGRDAKTKEIPEPIMRAPQSVVAAFISGLIEGDGSISQKRNIIHYGSISECLITQLTILLLHLGIFATKYETKKMGKGNLVLGRLVQARHPFFSLEIRGEHAQRLAEMLNLIGNKKRGRAERLAKRRLSGFERGRQTMYDRIPYAGSALFQELSESHIGSGWYRDIMGNKFRAGIKYSDGTKIRHSSDLHEKPLGKTQVVEWGIKDKLERIGSPVFSFLDDIVKNQIYFLKIVSIRESSEEDTYDIEVDGDHEFIANGIIAHNCLGKYHPHGDIAVYDTMVRMAQDFSLRYPLIQGQGNFGSIDGDGAAAHRYTEARMTSLAEELLRDIEKETVPFADNYDATRKEPMVLPAAIPNLLLNGTVGIAVGMATNIPPHNLTEVCDALTHLIDNNDASNDDLLEFVKGPDFPTGGQMFNEKEIRQAYASGKGAILTRATAEIVEDKKGHPQILITEIPYQVNKSELIEKMADLVHEKRVEGIKDIRDESDKDGLTIAIDLKDSAYPQKVLNNLYKYTDLEKTFHMHMLALVDGIQPETMSLKRVLGEYLKHRVVVVTRRTQFDLARAKERAHILEGLKKALDHIDAVIQTIKKSADRDEAHKNLIAKFKFSDAQATAILEMRLQTLAGLERQKIDDELKEKLARIKELEALLKDSRKIRAVIKKEIAELREKYGDERKTKLVKHAAREIAEEDLIPEEETIIALTQGGYIKRIKPDQYRAQRRGGKGIIGMETKEEDIVTHFIMANTHSQLLFFSSIGKVYQTRAYEVPEGSRISKGKAIQNFLPLGPNETITSVLAAPKSAKKNGASAKIFREKNLGGQKTEEGTKYLVMVTECGIIKKVDGLAFESVRQSGLIAIKLKKGDTLRWVKITTGKDDIVLVTRRGQAIRFSEKDVRPMGRGASGVKAMRLKKDDMAVGMDIVREASSQLLVVMEQGYGKRTPLKEYKRQRRGGSGIKTAKVTAKNGAVVSACVLHEDEAELIAISRKGQVIRTDLASVGVFGRATQGVRIMKLSEGDKLASITTL